MDWSEFNKMWLALPGKGTPGEVAVLIRQKPKIVVDVARYWFAVVERPMTMRQREAQRTARDQPC